MQEQVIIDFFQEMADAVKNSDISSFSSEADDGAKLARVYQKKRNPEIETAFGRVFFREDEEDDRILVEQGNGTEIGHLLKVSGMLEEAASIASKVMDSHSPETLGIEAVDDQRFRCEEYDPALLSEWVRTIESNLIYLDSVKQMVFKDLADYVAGLRLGKLSLYVFEGLAETELERIAEKWAQLFEQIVKVWNHAESRIREEDIARNLSGFVNDLKAKKEEELFINDGRVRISVPIPFSAD